MQYALNKHSFTSVLLQFESRTCQCILNEPKTSLLKQSKHYIVLCS